MRGSLPAVSAPDVLGALLSAFMSFIVSGIATAKAFGLTSGFLAARSGASPSSWLAVFADVLVVAPLLRRMVAYLTVHASTKA